MNRREALTTWGRWLIACGSAGSILALISRRGDACRLPLPCADCVLASRCSLPKRRDAKSPPYRRASSVALHPAHLSETSDEQ
jgi:hypothetical protein